MASPGGAVVGLLLAALIGLFAWMNWKQAARLTGVDERGRRQKARGIAIGYSAIAVIVTLASVLMLGAWALGG